MQCCCDGGMTIVNTVREAAVSPFQVKDKSNGVDSCWREDSALSSLQ